jgi:hypothetical protein
VDLLGTLRADLFQIGRFLVDGLEIRIELRPNSDKFTLMTPLKKGYKLNIVDAKLVTCKVQVSDAFYSAFSETLSHGNNIKYPYLRSDIRTLNFAQGLSTLSSDDIFQNMVPTRLILAMVRSEAYSGDYNLNPFNFQDFGASHIKVSVKDTGVPYEGIQLKYSKNGGQNILEGYMTLFQGMGTWETGQGNNISRDEYAAGGYCIYVFNIDSTVSDTGHMPLIQRGNLKVEIQLQTPLLHATTVIAYGVFPSQFEVDYARGVFE